MAIGESNISETIQMPKSRTAKSCYFDRSQFERRHRCLHCYTSYVAVTQTENHEQTANRFDGHLRFGNSVGQPVAPFCVRCS
jgi:hypothetical protein